MDWKFNDDFYYITKAKSWMERTGFNDKKIAKEIIKDMIGLAGCTIKISGNKATMNDEKVRHAKEILRGLNLIKN